LFVKVEPFRSEYLDGILGLCALEGWTTLPTDRGLAEQVLSAPGVVTLVAVENGEVVGFAQALSDGGVQAYLCLLAVAPESRRRGIGTRLLDEALAASGAMRIDALSTEGSDEFFRSFPHRAWSGYRINPEYAATSQPPRAPGGEEQ
jgi:ribosomal protein S18 acetylase RimI-like enzyme